MKVPFILPRCKGPPLSITPVLFVHVHPSGLSMLCQCRPLQISLVTSWHRSPLCQGLISWSLAQCLASTMVWTDFSFRSTWSSPEVVVMLESGKHTMLYFSWLPVIKPFSSQFLHLRNIPSVCIACWDAVIISETPWKAAICSAPLKFGFTRRSLYTRL